MSFTTFIHCNKHLSPLQLSLNASRASSECMGRLAWKRSPFLVKWRPTHLLRGFTGVSTTPQCVPGGLTLSRVWEVEGEVSLGTPLSQTVTMARSCVGGGTSLGPSTSPASSTLSQLVGCFNLYVQTINPYN